MTENLGSMTIDLSDDEDLEEHLSRKEPGDTCKFVIEAKLGEIVSQRASFTIESITVKNYAEPSDKTEAEEEPEEVEDEEPKDGPGAVAAMVAKRKPYEDE